MNRRMVLFCSATVEARGFVVSLCIACFLRGGYLNMLRMLVRSVLFCLVTAGSIVSLLSLFWQRAEMWDGPCSHKIEYGYFQFFRSSEWLEPTECANGILWAGVVMTAISVILIIAANLLAYKWLRPFRR